MCCKRQSTRGADNPRSEAATFAVRGPPTAKYLQEDDRAGAMSCLASAERLLAPEEDKCELRQHLRLARLASRFSLDIAQAQHPEEILLRIWTCCKQIWGASDIRVGVVLCKTLAPKQLAGRPPAPTGAREPSCRNRATPAAPLAAGKGMDRQPQAPKTGAREPSSKNRPAPGAAAGTRKHLDEELFCLDLTPATLLADEVDGARCQWFGHATSTRASDWQRLDLCHDPSLRRCFEEAEEVQDELDCNDWGLLQDGGIVGQCESILYVPLGTKDSRHLGVLRLVTGSSRGFGGAQRAALALVAEAAAARFQVLHRHYGMERRAQAAEAGRTRHQEASVAYRKMLDDMLPSHIIGKLCSFRGPRKGCRCEPEPEESPAVRMRPEGAPSELEETTPRDSLKARSPDGVAANRHLQPEAGNSRTEARINRSGDVTGSSSLKSGKQGPEPRAILTAAPAQLGRLTCAENHECAAILISDIKGFTKLSEAADPAEVMVMLDDLFGRFDAIVEKHAALAYKVETVGDAYMIAFGLFRQTRFPEDTPADYAVAMCAVTVGAEMVRAARLALAPSGTPVEIRVGVQLGRVMSGVIGKTLPRYCMFGDTVNMAGRMESTGAPGKIHVTERVQRACAQGKHGQSLAFCSTGGLQTKCKGSVETFLLEPDQVLGACSQLQRGAVEYARCASPCKHGSRPGCSPGQKGLQREDEAASALHRSASTAQADAARLREECLHTADALDSAEHLAACESPHELRRHLRLEQISSEATRNISRAGCPQQLLSWLWMSCKQIWSTSDVQLSIGLSKILAPQELAGHLPAPKGPGQPSGNTGLVPDMDEELFCLELTPDVLSAGEAEGWWPGDGASRWHRLGLCERPAWSRCFEGAEEVEEEPCPDTLGLPERRGAVEQRGSVLYLPLRASGKRLGVVRLATRGPEGLEAAERAAFASVAKAAAAHLQALLSSSEMERLCQALETDSAWHQEATASYRELLNGMLPSHIVDELWGASRRRDGHRRESEPEKSPVVPPWRGDAPSELEELWPEDNLSEHLSLGVGSVIRHLQLAVSSMCATMFGHTETVCGSSSVTGSNRGLQLCAIPARTSAQLDKLAYAENHECVAILFADIKGFAHLSEAADPADVMAMLDDLFARFDAIVDKYAPLAYKVETVGGVYMIAFGLFGQAGLPDGARRDCAVATHAVAVGAEMVRAAKPVLTPSGDPVEIRVGVQIGRIMSGIIGKKSPRYCMFGDTVNTASRMESAGAVGKVHVTERVRTACGWGKEGRALAFSSTGGKQIKGKGPMVTYLLDPAQVLGAGLQLQRDAVEPSSCTDPCKGSSCAECRPRHEDLQCQEVEAQGIPEVCKLVSTLSSFNGHEYLPSCLAFCKRIHALEGCLDQDTFRMAAKAVFGC